MLNETDFTPDEWEAIVSLPIKAGILVMWSHETNPLEFLSEVSTLTTAVIDAAESENPLISAVAQYQRDRNEEFRIEAPDSLEAAQHFNTVVIEQCLVVREVLKAKAAPEVGTIFKQWVVGIARRVAEASKEGGFLSLFGEDVSEYERETIERINDALGLPKH